MILITQKNCADLFCLEAITEQKENSHAIKNMAFSSHPKVKDVYFFFFLISKRMYTCIIGQDYSIKSNKVLHLFELFTFHIKQEAVDNSNNNL